MARYIAKRLGYMVFVFFIVSILQFTLFKMIPGDPVLLQLEGQTFVNNEQRQMAYDAMSEKMGLNKPLYEQYFIWITDTLQGDFGNSTIHKKPVIDIVGAPMKNTVTLNIITLILVFSITIPLGIVTAVRKNSLFDKTTQIATIVGYSMPTFVVALVFIVIFAVNLGLFPVSGTNSPGFSGTGMEAVWDSLKHMMLPIIVMTVSSLGGVTRYVRATMIDVLRMDYIRTARSKGLREKVVIYSHAFRNALIPVVTILTGWFIGIFSGSIVIESIFAWNGLGNLLISSLRLQDYFVVLAMNMFYIILALLSNLFLDLIYGLIDPRVKIS
ncbi:MAG: ABC transporter permease [Clostridia bacterium]